MAELTGEPPRVPRGLRLLPAFAPAAGVVGLLDHAVGVVAALAATMAVIGTTLLRLALEARTWRWPADAPYLLATAGLVLVITLGAVLGLRA